MNNTAPHMVIAGFFYAIAHYAQLSTELLVRILPTNALPRANYIADIAVAIVLWLFVLYLIPKACRLILAIYAIIGRIYDRIYAAANRKLIQFVRWLLARLTQKGPRK